MTDPAIVRSPFGPEVDGRRLLTEAVGFAREGSVGLALLYAGSSAVLGVLAVVVGRRIGAAVAGPAAVDLSEDEDL